MSFSESDSDVSDAMSYSVDYVNDLIEEITDHFKDILGTVKCKRVLDLREEMVKKPNKDKLAGWVINISDTLRRSRMLFLGASKYIDELQREVIDNQKETLGLQKELIKCKDVQLNGMQQTVQSEIRNLKSEVKDTLHSEIESYSDKVKNFASCTPAVAPENLQKIMKKVVEEDDRSKNLMIFGLNESGDETLKESVVEVLEKLNEKPKVETVCRIGTVKTGCNRPVKIVFRNSETVHQILLKSWNLKNIDELKSVFMAPDRCSEERKKHRELVLQLKEKRKEDNNKHYVIRNGRVVCVDGNS